jgi:outer membrane protein assembly factor BamA
MIRILLIVLILMLGLKSLGQDTTKTKPDFAIYPALGYSPETKLQIGAISFLVFDNRSKKENFYRPTSISPYIIYSTNNQLSIAIDADIYLQNNYNLNMDLEYSDYPDNYYGIGNETHPDSSERYKRSYLRADGRFMKPITNKLYAGLLFDLGHVKVKDINDGGLLEKDNPTGIEGGAIIGLGLGAVFDSRNNTLYPTKGKLIMAGVSFFNKVIGSQYNFTNLILDYRQYFTVFDDNSIVALQFRADMTSGNVPFYNLSKLGGDNQLRGIANENLYTDRHSVYGQIEGRQKLFWRFGGVLFVGVGEVFPKFSDFDLKDIRVTYGIGGRFQALKDQPLNLRVDLGFTSNGQNALYVSIKEAF